MAVMTTSLISLARVSIDKIEVQDLVSRRRWRMNYPCDGISDAAWLPGGVLDRLGTSSLDERGAKIFALALQRGWRLSAAYLAATDSYPFLDYSDSGFREDRIRMREYSAEHPDDLRTVQAEEQSKPTSGPKDHSTPRYVTDIEKLALAVFGSTTWSKMPWEGKPIFRRTSASGGSRHPINGYLVPAGARNMLYVNPGSNALEDSLRSAPGPSAFDRLLLTISPDRNRYRYREPRTFRTIFMDLGHLLQTLNSIAGDFGFVVSVSDLLFPRVDLSKSPYGEMSPLAEVPAVVCTLRRRSSESDVPIFNDTDDWIEYFGRRIGKDDLPVWGMVMTGEGDEGFAVTPRTVEVVAPDPGRQRHFANLDLWNLDSWIDTGWGLAMNLFFATGEASASPIEVPACTLRSPLHTAYVRRSARKFGSLPVSIGALSSIVANQSYSDSLSIYAIAFRIEGLAPGVHRWHHDRWEWVGELIEPDIAGFGRQVMTGQPAVMSSAAVLCVVADLDHAASADAGEQALMQVWIEAGAVVQGWHLLATEAGAAGYPTPAIHDASMDALLGLEVGRQMCVHTLVFGSRHHA